MQSKVMQSKVHVLAGSAQVLPFLASRLPGEAPATLALRSFPILIVTVYPQKDGDQGPAGHQQLDGSIGADGAASGDDFRK
jgi:hypothetical protein